MSRAVGDVRDHAGVTLELVTGPANSAKAKLVLDGYRDALARDPLLVVPRAPDVEHYRRELAGSGAVFGVRVMRFDGLIGEIARRAGVPGRPLSEAARQRIAARAAARARLKALAESARTPGFPQALARWAAELESQRVDPSGLERALRAWAGRDPARLDYATELAALYRAYRQALDRLGRTDRELYALAALDAISVAPAAWGSTPVFLYGFDDFTAIELDAIETLARVVRAPVTVSLSYEPGRRAFAGRAEVAARLAELADDHHQLPARAEYYAPASAGALHHLERALFEEGPAKGPAADAVQMLEAPSARAELEMVADRVARLLADGMLPEQIAVVMRGPALASPLIDEVFAERGVPISRDRREPFAHTSLGRGLIGLLRSALLQGTGEDLLAWLRTPGVLEVAELADRLERSLRCEGAETAEAARAVWERERWSLDAIDRLRDSRERGPVTLLRQVRRELEGLFAAGRRRRAALLDELERQDAVALAAAGSLMGELAELAAVDRTLVDDPAELVHALASLPVPAGDASKPGVQVSDPLWLRARRVRALFVCGLAAGVFPAPAPTEPFLAEDQRREAGRASGLALAHTAPHLDSERFLFYATVSRPEELLVLSWHTADDDGIPCLRSLYVDDVIEVFEAEITIARPEPLEPEPAALAGATIAPLTGSVALGELGARPAWSASSLELWAGCPVRWFVERFLNPEDLDPEAEALQRGGVAHAVLEETLTELGRRTGSARLEPERLVLARELMAEALRAHAQVRPLSAEPARRRVLVRRLQSDLERYLAYASRSGTTFEPRHLEVEFGDFGGRDDSEEASGDEPGDADQGDRAGELAGGEPTSAGFPALELAVEGRSPLRLRGRIDRVDVNADGRQAIVYDYKGRAAVGGRAWDAEGVLQIPLYMLAVRELMGLEAVGGFYQPLAGGDPRARGALVEGADPALECVSGDRFEADELRKLIDDAVDRALDAADEARAGLLQPRPRTCSPRGGCSYPVLCRCEGS